MKRTARRALSGFWFIPHPSAFILEHFIPRGRGSAELLQTLRHGFEGDVDGGVRLGEDGDAEGPGGSRKRRRGGEDGEAERVALARAGRPLHDEDALLQAPADDLALRRRQTVRPLRLGGEARELPRVAHTFRADGA